LRIDGEPTTSIAPGTEPAGLVRLAKLDDADRTAAGWFSVFARADGSPVIDSQGDIISGDGVEKAARAFKLFARDLRDGDLQHELFGVSRLVELVVTTADVQKAMGIPEGTVPVGVWGSFYFPETEAGEMGWQKAKAGEWREFSLVGRGKRHDVDADAVAAMGAR
jgi:hypothetical protein